MATRIGTVGGDHFGAEGFAELDAGGADATGAAMHQKCFTGLQLRADEYVAPYGEKSLGQPGGIDQRNAFRYRQAMVGVDQTVLGITAAVGETAQCVADFPARDAFAHGGDDAGDFQPQKIGCAGGRGIQPFALHHVRAVDAGGGDFDQHFACFRGGNGALCQREHVGATGFTDFNHVHGLHGYPVIFCSSIFTSVHACSRMFTSFHDKGEYVL